jgi:uncharacterized membrane protein
MDRALAMAQSDLIIIVFDQPEDAFWARRALELLREHHAFGLAYAAEITRDSAGRTTLHHHMALPAYPHAPHTRMPSLLCDAIFSPGSKENHRKLAKAGLDEFFLLKVTQALIPGRSALLLFVAHDSYQVDLQALFGVITLLKGILHRTTVPWELEKTLLSHAQPF